MKEKRDPQAPVFDKSELIAKASEVFGTSPELMAGALHNVTEPIGVGDAKAQLESWLVQPVADRE